MTAHPPLMNPSPPPRVICEGSPGSRSNLATQPFIFFTAPRLPLSTDPGGRGGGSRSPAESQDDSWTVNTQICDSQLHSCDINACFHIKLEFGASTF